MHTRDHFTNPCANPSTSLVREKLAIVRRTFATSDKLTCAPTSGLYAASGSARSRSIVICESDRDSLAGLYQLMAVCHLSVGVSAVPAHRQLRRNNHPHTPAQAYSCKYLLQLNRAGTHLTAAKHASYTAAATVAQSKLQLGRNHPSRHAITAAASVSTPKPAKAPEQTVAPIKYKFVSTQGHQGCIQSISSQMVPSRNHFSIRV